MSTISTFVEKKQNVKAEGLYVIKAENVIDFSVTPCSSADVVQALKIPANSVVYKVGVNVITAETGTHTVGDAGDPNGYFTALDSSATGVVFAGGADAAGKYYSANDTIDFTLGADMDSGKVNVFAIYARLEN